MNLIIVDKNNLDEAVEFMYRLNNCPEHHIGYCGKNKDEIKSSVAELLDEDNRFFIVKDNNKIIAALGYEWYDDNVEVWGPFICEKNTEALNMLWDSMLSSINNASLMYMVNCNIENSIAREFSINKGYKLLCEGKIMQINLNEINLEKNINISIFNENDKNEVIRLHDIAFPNSYCNGEQLIEKIDDDNMVIVIHDGQNKNAVIGYVSLFMEKEFNEGDIEFIAIDEKYRKRGYGKKLLFGALNAFKNNGITNLQLWVNVINANAIRLYTSVGFKTIDGVISYSSKGE